MLRPLTSYPSLGSAPKWTEPITISQRSKAAVPLSQDQHTIEQPQYQTLAELRLLAPSSLASKIFCLKGVE